MLQVVRLVDNKWEPAGIITDMDEWIRLIGRNEVLEHEPGIKYRVMNGTEIICELKLRDNES